MVNTLRMWLSTTMQHRPGNLRRAVWLGLASAAALCAWGMGIGHRAFDYDEIYHAHAIWLIWQGHVPFHEFFACHPPFAWYAFVPLWNLLPSSPGSLIPLRVAAAAGVAVWLVTLAENLPPGSGHFTTLDLPVFPCSSSPSRACSILRLEFRPDAWCYALLSRSLWLFRLKRPGGSFARHAVFAFAASWAVMSTPKCLLLVVFFVVFDFGLSGKWRDCSRCLWD